MRYQRRKKRRHDVSGFSLQSPLHNTEHTEWGDLLDHDDAAGQWPQIPSSQDATERSLDVAAVLATLPIELRPLCECLARSSGAAVRRELHLTKHAFRKALVQLREHFAAAGLQQESGRIFGSPDAKRRM